MNLSPESFVLFLQNLSPEMLSFLMLIACFSCLLLMYRLFGVVGLYVYIVVAIIGANIQVLKVVKFGVFADPVALGTILFASTYLATDILAEHHGKQAANTGVWLGFAGYLLFVLFMLLNLGYAPLTPAQAGETMAWALPYHDYMVALFQPQTAFFVAGMVAYLLSQFHDVWLFHWLRDKTLQKHLWLRNNVSTMLSSLIDNTVFSILAWIVLNPEPLPLEVVIYTYILGTYWLRLIVGLFDTPFMYLAHFCKPKPFTNTVSYA